MCKPLSSDEQETSCLMLTIHMDKNSTLKWTLKVVGAICIICRDCPSCLPLKSSLSICVQRRTEEDQPKSGGELVLRRTAHRKTVRVLTYCPNSGPASPGKKKINKLNQIGA